MCVQPILYLWKISNVFFCQSQPCLFAILILSRTGTELLWGSLTDVSASM